MAKIDVHVLSYAGFNESWHQQCLSSIEMQPSANVLVFSKSDPLHIGRARFKAYDRGVEEYVSFVNESDFLEYGILSRCLKEFEADPFLDGVCTLERVINVPRNKVFDPILSERTWERFAGLHPLHSAHLFKHVNVFKRSSLGPYLQYLTEWALNADEALVAAMLMNNCKIKMLREIGYNFRFTEPTLTQLQTVELGKAAKLFISKAIEYVDSNEKRHKSMQWATIKQPTAPEIEATPEVIENKPKTNQSMSWAKVAQPSEPDDRSPIQAEEPNFDISRFFTKR